MKGGGGVHSLMCPFLNISRILKTGWRKNFHSSSPSLQPEALIAPHQGWEGIINIKRWGEKCRGALVLHVCLLWAHRRVPLLFRWFVFIYLEKSWAFVETFFTIPDYFPKWFSFSWTHHETTLPPKKICMCCWMCFNGTLTLSLHLVCWKFCRLLQINDDPRCGAHISGCPAG